MNFSEEFKDLYNTKLIAYNPQNRLTIKEYPWMILSKPSFDKMKMEFEDREKAVLRGFEIEIQQKGNRKKKE